MSRTLHSPTAAQKQTAVRKQKDVENAASRKTTQKPIARWFSLRYTKTEGFMSHCSVWVCACLHMGGRLASIILAAEFARGHNLTDNLFLDG